MAPAMVDRESLTMYLADYSLSVQRLKGVGPGIGVLFSKIDVFSCLDLLLLLPRAYEDRTRLVGLEEALREKKPVYTTGRVISHGYFGSRRAVLKIRFSDHLGQEGGLLCFNRDYLKDKYPPGSRFHLFGTPQLQYQEIQISQFEITPVYERQPGPPGFGSILPIYPATAGLKQSTIRKAMAQALQHLQDVTEEIPDNVRNKYGLASWLDSLQKIHTPRNLEEIEKVRRSLAFRELWFLIGNIQLERHLRLNIEVKHPAYPRTLLEKAVHSIPFQLTQGQKNAIHEILEDLNSGRCMARLLQGDVGAGKTLVAVLSAIPVLEAGEQVAFMAPTELLAQQHFKNLAKILEPLQLKTALLTSSTPADARVSILKQIASGELNLVVGTHSLLSKEIIWRNLSYVIVDEQHRFGVRQREALLKSGSAKHLLMMSATPIPRSLALTVFGDLDVTTLPELPSGRHPITTYLVSLGNIKRVWDYLAEKLKSGQQAYVVVPLIEESEKRSIIDLYSVFETLKSAFPNFEVGIVHGRMKDQDKTAAMDAFKSGSTKILCATSVVEVGVDVPNATCMVIYHAELYGLSTLHQLRGRVGRGSLPGFCFLVFAPDLTEEAKQRLKMIRETSNGFELAEADLDLRGPGEFLGMRQSGYARLRMANWHKDADLMLTIRDEILDLLKNDPQGPWIGHLRNGSLFKSSAEDSF